ncbi:hypothetical protein HGRIS_002995 [Hohenbuehelia grisea]|uniref:Gti1/Pac2 family-domain-containing protein n=1 Tax=Hohenbuehelia grisea TaxID=104357 RepID=A0ABR3JN01_9AGAR
MQSYYQPTTHGRPFPSNSVFSLQRATCAGIRIRSPADARVIFHAVALNVLPIVTRRLDAEERSSITPGSVYVWEERGPHAEATGLGIERWTDGIRWGPSRVRDGFLFYHEKENRQSDSENMSPIRPAPSRGLIKQTYSVFVDTEHGRKKWHLIAYFTEESLSYLRTIHEHPHLATLLVPHGKYKSARSAKGRIRDQIEDDYVEPSIHIPHSSPHQGPPTSPLSAGSQTSPLDPRRFLPQQPRYEYPRFRDDERYSVASSSSSEPDTPSHSLAPLAYLENIAPMARHPVDEKVLMMFSPTIS